MDDARWLPLPPGATRRPRAAVPSSPPHSQRPRDMVGLLRHLQRTLGNRRVDLLLRQHGGDLGELQRGGWVAGGGPAVPLGNVQRAIGLEFQLKTNLWRGAREPKSGEAALLPYGEEVFRHSGFYKVESDDGEVEFITDPFAEDVGGLERLTHAAQQAAAFAEALVEAVPANGTPVTTVTDAAKRYGTGTLVGSHDAHGPWVGNFGEPTNFPHALSLAAKPQATFGLSLARLHELATMMMTEDASLPSGTTSDEDWQERAQDAREGAAAWGKRFLERRDAAAQDAQAKGASAQVLNFVALIHDYVARARDISDALPTEEEDAKDRVELEDTIKKALGFAEAERQEAETLQAAAKAKRQEAENLEAVAKTQKLREAEQDEAAARKKLQEAEQDEEVAKECAADLKELQQRKEKRAFYGAATHEPLAYPKAAHPIMARTNFRAMFGSLSPNERRQARTLLDDQRLEEATGRALDDRLYPGGYYDDSLAPQHWGKLTPVAKQAIVPGPTIREWLATVFPPEGDAAQAQQDGMQGRLAPHVPNTPSDRGMGALNRAELVPTREHAKAEVTLRQAPVFEYRFFEGPLMPHEWRILAAELGKVVQLLNARGPVTLSAQQRAKATPPAPSNKDLPHGTAVRQVGEPVRLV